MGIINVFGKGSSTHGKHSSQLNLPSEMIDRRKHKAYRNSRTQSYKAKDFIVKDGYMVIITTDGDEIKTTIRK